MPPRNYRNSSRRSRTPTLILGGLGLFALMSVGIVGTLWLAGVPLNPFAVRKPVENPFMVRIPINSQPIPAYTRVDRKQLMNPTSGGLMYQKLPPGAAVGMAIVGVDQNGSHVESRVESIKNDNDEVVFVVTDGAEVRQGQTFSLGGAIMNINAIIGRVVKADKRAGLGFQESTFFPPGTPEGLAGATPQGMRAITLDATRLTGVHSLGAGDLIDLLASIPVSGDGDQSSAAVSEVELLAQNAKVLRPVYVRNEVSSSASLMNGKTMQNTPKYEVAIAVAADDVIPLQNALNQELPITCVAHSMKPISDDETNLVASSSDEIRVPVTVRPILAYQVVSREAFVSPATRSIKTVTISKLEADRMNVISSIGDALGAITRQDIPAGRYLRHEDLLKGPPKKQDDDEVSLEAVNHRTSFSADGKRFVSMLQTEAAETAPSATAVGDRPAITTFIPPGRTAFSIPLNRIFGAEHLQIGDTIDLLASYSLERLRDEEETETRPDGTVIVRKSESLTPRTTQRSWEETFGNRAEPWFVASDAIVVAPVGFPAPAAALRAIQSPAAQPNNDNGFTGPSVIIAVADQDVEPFATAMASRDALFTVAFHAAESQSTSPRRKTIAIAPETIAAYSELSETAWKGNRRDITTRSVSTSDPQFAQALALPELQALYGRVLKRDKARGDFFTADDFLPEGTASGIAATARVGFTLLPIANAEIEGLDSFESGDHVSILIRGVVKSLATRKITAEGGVATSAVVAPMVRIARGSVAGQTVLEVRNEDLTRLQAAIARSLTARDELKNRSHLVAVGIERRNEDSIVAGNGEIPSFDPFANVKTTEVIIGGQRSVEVYGGGGL
ncbi:RcpC/CpaB family pilus assembly protein [Stieleria varia]|uniref:SAF domain-containing protein n=1 Tax=Stieleria varia TaxID=2528005 RepID=A0A5C6A5F1_9BACT|nr:hypothetical protein [Stieleria varia]TWT94719.1 hypothetical protein Pla52n_55440 [Stieleria varia]